jgi:hypothetical protein
VTWQQDSHRGVWRTCEACGERYNDRVAHIKTHVERPSDDHLTVREASEALGKARTTVDYWIKHGRIKTERTLRGPVRCWVTRQALRAFVRESVEENFSAAADWAKTGAFSG